MCTIWMKLDHFEWFHGKMEILRCCPQRSWEFWWIMSLCEITLLKRSTSRVFCYCYRRSAEQRVTHRCIFSGTLTSILPFISLAIWSQILLFCFFVAFLLLFPKTRQQFRWNEGHFPPVFFFMKRLQPAPLLCFTVLNLCRHGIWMLFSVGN